MRKRRIRRSRSALSLSNGLRDLCELLFKIPGFVFHSLASHKDARVIRYLLMVIGQNRIIEE
jgi:hypothetical protein